MKRRQQAPVRLLVAILLAVSGKTSLALACNPNLLIVDEPISALDTLIRTRIIRLIRNLQQRHGFAKEIREGREPERLTRRRWGYILIMHFEMKQCI